ncbi:hypothetical protein K439DRAFT_1624775 [Ramaria rubella]|nr:hypothetical protein K439DRAFT_1624775 [Ramaria rubella]
MHVDVRRVEPVDQHIRHIPLTSISSLVPFSGLIITIVFYYVLELFLVRKIYGNIYTDLHELNRRGFVNHHIAGTTKFIILIAAAYPFISVAFGTGALRDKFAKGYIVTLGDILLVATQMLLVIYIFELIYRTKVSPVSIVHHIGAIMVGQSAVALILNVIHQKDASIEFILCTYRNRLILSFAFDIIFEILPHVAIILYRTLPNSHLFLRNLFRAACFTTLLGTVAETIVTMYLFGQLWNQWRIAFKIVTPLLHVAFSAAQLHGTRIFFRMWKKQVMILDGLRAADIMMEATVDKGKGGAELQGGSALVV